MKSSEDGGFFAQHGSWSRSMRPLKVKMQMPVIWKFNGTGKKDKVYQGCFSHFVNLWIYKNSSILTRPTESLNPKCFKQKTEDGDVQNFRPGSDKIDKEMTVNVQGHGSTSW